MAKEQGNTSFYEDLARIETESEEEAQELYIKYKKIGDIIGAKPHLGLRGSSQNDKINEPINFDQTHGVLRDMIRRHLTGQGDSSDPIRFSRE